MVKDKVHKAVIPAAGLGIRFLPVTKSMPKEMLPIVDKPVIHYVIEEAVSSGIDDIIIITGRGKRAIEDYFDTSPELEMRLSTKNKNKILNKIKEISEFPDIHYIRQREPNGLGDAILKSKQHIGDEPFAVLLGDDIIRHSIPCTLQLINTFSIYKSSIISVESIPDNNISNYGIVKGKPSIGSDIFKIDDIIEKPKLLDAPSNFGAVGRYIFTPEIFDCLENLDPGVGNEIQLTDAIRKLLKTQPVYAYKVNGIRYDAGDKLGYIKAIIDFSLMDEQLKLPLMKFLKGRTL
jgi:UTP--glucose-1-phosphate uridylyltransferase